MSSPNPNQQWQGWSGQQYQQPSSQYPNHGYSQANPQTQPYGGYYAPSSTSYVQPHYGNTSLAPVIAELPAPLPSAPPTTTPEQQLKEDELLAHKLQQIEVEDVRRRSSSQVTQHRRHSSLAPSPQGHSPLLGQPPSPLLRPHSQSVSSNTLPYVPDSRRQPTSPQSISSLPEVVVGPHSGSYSPQSPSDNLPIPIIHGQHITQTPLSLFDSVSISTYLEQHRQVPYPPQWKLPPVVVTFYAFQGPKIATGLTWLGTPDSFSWRTIRPTGHVHRPIPPSYTFRFKTSGGSFRSPKHTWVMTCPEEKVDQSKKLSKSQQPRWGYDLKFDSSTGMRKTEVLAHGPHKPVLTTYVHALNYDSLRFIGPDGRAYMWVSSTAVSSINGSRYDILRHALFASTGRIPDPLYGEIVADHTFWDGFVDQSEVHAGIRCDVCQTMPIKGLRWRCRTCPNHDVCNACRGLALSGQLGASIQPTCDFSLVNLPDEAVYIRSSIVDPALVVATLQVLKDWEKHSLRMEKGKNNKGFLVSEEAARKCDLGLMSYWKAGDLDMKSVDGERVGTRVKAKGLVVAFGETANALGNVGDAAFALAGYGWTSSGGTGSSGHSGDGGGGGFSGGGGDGGGGGGGSSS
ncbi:hypothetical protein BKA66DRAFT_567245 [Pyrenochaeta sp. MPI-SDFR-AT-0127]|nr:hypothetical protein BKA66DRAFT_567245 [Pyrenochaeta sp. MPI-SDFR-AT-0127]